MSCSDGDHHEDDIERKHNLFPWNENHPHHKKFLSMQGHKKTVSALSMDHAGSRFVSGGHDNHLCFWDFNGMDGANVKPFRTLEEPCGGHIIRDVHFAPKGASDKVLIIPYSAQAKIMTREGAILTEFAKGDQYLLDMKNTKGHTTCMNSGSWHPTNPKLVATAANDSTVRFWDIEDSKKQKGMIVVKSKLPGTKSPVTCIRYSSDGRSIYTASQDGSLKHWLVNASYNYPRPLTSIDHAHASGAIISDVQVSTDNTKILSRSLDGTMQLWDARKFKEAIHCWKDLPALFDETSALFCDGDRYIMTAVSADPTRSIPGAIHIFDAVDYRLVDAISSTGSTSPVRLVWHERLRQFLVGYNDGCIHAFFDETLSEKGAKLVKVHRARPDAFVVSESRPNIYTPHSLPLFREESKSLKRQREKARLDPAKSHRPDLPVEGPGKGGKIGSNLTQHLIHHIVQDRTRDEDPREALLKYAKIAENDPKFITHVYEKTQPITILADKTIAEEEEPQQEDSTI